jgi:hypothetical protein
MQMISSYAQLIRTFSGGGVRSCQTLNRFANIFATGGNDIVEVFESLTTSF